MQTEAQGTREEWLASLESKSEVAISQNRGYEIATVCRTTATQIILLSPSFQEWRFSKRDGKVIGTQGSYNPRRLVPVTDSIREKAIRQRILNKIHYQDFDKLATAQLAAIERVLGIEQEGANVELS